MRSSSGEVAIYNALSDSGVPFVEEYTFEDLRGYSGELLRFDFAVFNDDGSLDFLIEYNGIQHYKPVSAFGGSKSFIRQRKNDQLKKDYCRKHGIRLVEIPYSKLSVITFDYIMRCAGYY